MARPSSKSQAIGSPGKFANASRQRIALVLQYLGTQFHGWQWQTGLRTVQGELEQVLASVLSQPVRVHGAGRTDAGVHAAAQVAHFDAPDLIPAHRWSDIFNSRLSQDVLVRASAGVSHDWHAQFSASWRRYRYTIYTDQYPNLFLREFVWHYYQRKLDVDAVQKALDPLVGFNDLTAFHRSRSGRAHSWVELQEASCKQDGPFLTVELQAKGFLYGMVRLIVGLLIEVGAGAMLPEEFTHIWQEKHRNQVKYSAPARGLCLLRVGYDSFPFPRESWFNTQPYFCLETFHSRPVV